MDKDRFESAMCLWGRVFGRSRPPVEAQERSLTGNSTLARFGRPDGYVAVADGRCGASRRRAMGAAAGIRMVPAAYVDPVPCKATHIVKAPDFDARITVEVERVDAAWHALRRSDDLLAQVLRVQYQEPGDQSDKCRRVKDGMTLRQYKEHLKLAKVWMMGRLAA